MPLSFSTSILKCGMHSIWFQPELLIHCLQITRRIDQKVHTASGTNTLFRIKHYRNGDNFGLPGQNKCGRCKKYLPEEDPVWGLHHKHKQVHYLHQQMVLAAFGQFHWNHFDPIYYHQLEAFPSILLLIFLKHSLVANEIFLYCMQHQLSRTITFSLARRKPYYSRANLLIKLIHIQTKLSPVFYSSLLLTFFFFSLSL